MNQITHHLIPPLSCLSSTYTYTHPLKTDRSKSSALCVTNLHPQPNIPPTTATPRRGSQHNTPFRRSILLPHHQLPQMQPIVQRHLQHAMRRLHSNRLFKPRVLITAPGDVNIDICDIPYVYTPDLDLEKKPGGKEECPRGRLLDVGDMGLV